jgi:hypothetical protein
VQHQSTVQYEPGRQLLRTLGLQQSRVLLRNLFPDSIRLREKLPLQGYVRSTLYVVCLKKMAFQGPLGSVCSCPTIPPRLPRIPMPKLKTKTDQHPPHSKSVFSFAEQIQLHPILRNFFPATRPGYHLPNPDTKEAPNRRISERSRKSQRSSLDLTSAPRIRTASVLDVPITVRSTYQSTWTIRHNHKLELTQARTKFGGSNHSIAAFHPTAYRHCTKYSARPFSSTRPTFHRLPSLASPSASTSALIFRDPASSL